jgi:hypothetical protein
MAVNGPTIELTLGNSATGTLYVRDLQVRGTMLQAGDEQMVTRQNQPSIALYGKRSPYTYTLPLSTSVTWATSVAYYLLGRYQDPQYRAEGYEVADPLSDPDDFFDLFACELGDVIQITAYQNATTGKKSMIRSFDCDFDADGISRLAWGLIDLEDTTYWILGHDTYGRLGNTTRLGL